MELEAHQVFILDTTCKNKVIEKHPPLYDVEE
jgi:hypothetical protein